MNAQTKERLGGPLYAQRAHTLEEARKLQQENEERIRPSSGVVDGEALQAEKSRIYQEGVAVVNAPAAHQIKVEMQALLDDGLKETTAFAVAWDRVMEF